MAIFNCYVSLPEGKPYSNQVMTWNTGTLMEHLGVYASDLWITPNFSLSTLINGLD